MSSSMELSETNLGVCEERKVFEEDDSNNQMEVDSPSEPPSESSSTKLDANDYSRFNNVDDSDSDGADTDPSTDDEKRSIGECIFAASGHKDAGNASFKNSKYSEAKRSYELGITALKNYADKKPPVITESEYNDMVAALVSLHGNKAMVQIKEETWSGAVKSATEVLKLEPDNIKALYRRGLAYSRLLAYEKSKTDLMKTIELDPNNTPAKKELAELTKLQKEQQKKEKAAYSNIFNKTSMYDDKEKEREEKKRREELQREKDRDEWTKSKISRREQGLDEQTFDVWKEEQDKLRKEAEEAKKEQERKRSKEQKSIKKKKTEDQNSTEEYDDEDAKIINETKKKGYCYFNTKPTDEVKSLIGDISPKTVDKKSLETSSSTSVDDLMTMDTVTSSVSSTSAVSSNEMKVAASSWNHAGTWEERDLSIQCREKLKEYIESIGDVDIPNSFLNLKQEELLDALGDINMEGKSTPSSTSSSSSTTQEEKSLSSLSNLLSNKNIKIKITKVDSIEGDAQIVLARNKKRHIFDLNMKLEFEVAFDDSSSSSTSSKKKSFKGTMNYVDIAPNSHVEAAVSFKKDIPTAFLPRVKEAVTMLKKKVSDEIQKFEVEFKNM
eukprot:gene6947-14102_t